MANNNRTRRRVERIKKDLNIVQVLIDLGYPVHGVDREEQFPCDLHGDGRDGKPSARIYPESNSFYCWACAKVRDSIELVREKKGLGFIDALNWLEQQYGFPAIPWEPEEPEKTVVDEVTACLDTSGTFEKDRLSLESFLDSITKDKMLPLADILVFWEGFDKLMWLVTEKQIPEIKGRILIVKLRDRILNKLKGL